MKKYIPFKIIDPKQIYKGPISAEPTNTCVDLVLYNPTLNTRVEPTNPRVEPTNTCVDLVRYNPKFKIGSKKHRDLLRKHNISTYPNYVVTLDVTKMGVNGQCITAQDVATRKILAYVYKEAPLDSLDITDCILAAIEDAGGKPPICIVHSDRESILKKKHYYQFLDAHNILWSRTDAQAGGNMVTERTFRSVKIIIRVKLDPRYTELRKPEYGKLQPPDPLTIVQDPAVMCRVIREAFSEYNSAPHTANYGASPNTTQDALIVSLLQENGQFPKVQFYMDDNNNAENTFFKLDGQIIPVLAQQVPSQELLAAMSELKL
jgi:hypothetical protein